MKNGYRIVDGHVHTFPTDEVALKIIRSFNEIYNIKYQNPGTGSIENVLTNMEKCGIDYTVMANFAPPKILHEKNLWGLEVARLHNNLIPLVSFHPVMEGSLRKHLEFYVENGAKGIKIHPTAQGFEPGHKQLDELYESCSEIGFPIVYHCGRVANARLNNLSDLDMILPVIERFASIPFILTHMADGDIDAVIRLVKNYNNVYFDTSIVITGFPAIMQTNEPSWIDNNIVEDVINTIGAERVIFGSDYPWGSPCHDIDRFLGMKLSDEQKKSILADNAIRIFNIQTHDLFVKIE